MTALRRARPPVGPERRLGSAGGQGSTASGRFSSHRRVGLASEGRGRRARSTILLRLVLVALSLGAVGIGARGTSYAIDEYLRLRAEAAGTATDTRGSIRPWHVPDQGTDPKSIQISFEASSGLA